MIASSAQWLVAAAIAVAIHVAGVLWLHFASPERSTRLERAGEGIVVTLGRDSQRAAEDTEALAPARDAAQPAAAEAAAPEPPAAVKAAEAAVESPAVIRNAPPVESQTPNAAEPQTPNAAEPQAPNAAEPVEPSAVDASAPARAAVTETAVAPAESEPEPAVVKASDARQASASRPEEVTAKAPRVPIQSRAAGASVESVKVPAASTDRESAPEVPILSAPVGEVRGLDVASAAPEPAVSAAPAKNVSQEAAPVGEAALAEPEASPPRAQLESVGPAPAAAPSSETEVVAARAPAPATEPAAVREVQAAQPRTVDLEQLQRASGGTGVVARYAGILKGWLQKNMHYPRAARLAGQEGRVVVRFVIDRDGNVQSVKLESGSGFPLLDREAKEMIERGNPFPAMPEEMAGGELEVRVPVSFHVRDETVTREIPPIDLQ